MNNDLINENNEENSSSETIEDTSGGAIGGTIGGLVGGQEGGLSSNFSNGASYLISEQNYYQYIAQREFIGRPDGQFVAPFNEMDDLLIRANGDTSIMETALGLPEGSLGTNPMRVDIYNPEAYNLRLPDNSMSGSNDFFVPGGKTSGGVSEGVIDSFPNPIDNPAIGNVNNAATSRMEIIESAQVADDIARGGTSLSGKPNIFRSACSFVAKHPDATARALTYGAIGISAVSMAKRAYQQFEAGNEEAGYRTIARWGVTNEAAAIAGWGGAKLGAAAGTAIGGPVGTIVGGVLGFALGMGFGWLAGELSGDLFDLMWEDTYYGYEAAGYAQPPRDPLIIDLGAPGIVLTSVDNGVHFDLDKNGFAEKTAWIGDEDGFLVLDRNKNGFIDNGGELFSDQVVMNDNSISTSGFEALAELDDNVDEENVMVGDGIIDENDSEFKHLMVWIDKNQNGISEEDELTSLEDMGIVSISLDHINKNVVDSETNTMITDSSVVTFKNGDKSEISEHWFVVKQFNTEERDEDGKNIITDSVKSYGNVKSLNTAIIEDESGVLGKLVERFKNSENYAEKRVLINKILLFITDSYEVDLYSRGGNIDARKLNVIEKFMGTEFIGVDGSNIPNSNAATILKNVYNNIENNYFNILNSECDSSDYIDLVIMIKNEDESITFDFSILNFALRTLKNNGENIDNIVYGIGSWLSNYDIVKDQNILDQYTADVSAEFNEYKNIKEFVKISSVIIGSGENDSLNGLSAADIIWGDDGNDKINASGGNDFIYGGTGDDILNGGAGDDTYYFEKNHGNDIIHDTEGNNELVFTDGISAVDYDMSIDAKLGFVLTHKETGETISMPDFLTNPLNYNFVFEEESQIESGIENREVIEGTNADDYLEAGDGFNIFYGGDGNDTLAGGKDMDFMYGGDGDDLLLGKNGVNVLFGDNGNDTIYDGDDGSYLSGGDGDDFLYGGGGADVLDGGAGNDYLQGDHGGDTYVFGKGYDTDIINASSDDNTIIIHGYTANQMVNTRNAHNDLIIHFGKDDSTDCLIVDHFFDYNSNRDINFVFDDGTVLGQYDITAKYEPIQGTDADEWLAIQNSDNGIIHAGCGNDGLSGGSGNDELYGEAGNDTLYGNDGNDTLDGGTSNDTLCGGNGEDTYIFAKGYGADTINEWGSDHSIISLTDINSDEVTVSDQWGSNLLIAVNGTEDVITISNFKWGQSTFTFKFADGAEGYVDKNTWQLVLTKQPDPIEEDTEQAGAELLTALYEDESLAADLFESDSTVIDAVTESVSINEETDDISELTDVQAMLLAENMSAFGNDEQISDSVNIADITADTSALDQLLVGTMQ